MAAYETRGGIFGRVLRRLVHFLSLSILPIIYYDYGLCIASFFSISAQQFVLICLMIIMILEALRLSLHWQLLGQRLHERNHFSSFAWAALGLSLLLLLLPNKMYATPIAWTCALADPVMGELRRLNLHKGFVFLVGFVCSSFVWFLGFVLFGSPIVLGLLLGLLAIIVEYPKLKWIDDNALMMWVPLGVVLCFI